MPQNSGGNRDRSRRLDCTVIERLHKLNEAVNKSAYDSVRGFSLKYPSVLKRSRVETVYEDSKHFIMPVVCTVFEIL